MCRMINDKIGIRQMRLMKIGFVVLASGCLWGCASQLTVTSGGQMSAGYCNHIEKTWGALYGTHTSTTLRKGLCLLGAA